MSRSRSESVATVGVAEHGNSAELLTVTRGGELLDRRRIGGSRGQQRKTPTAQGGLTASK